MAKINEISTAMAKGFAAELTEKMNNGMLKKGCPIMRGVLTVKSGKETEIREGVKRVSITVKVNYPFNILKPSNRRIEVIVENGELRNVKEIMYVALDTINWIGRKIVSFTKGYWCDLDSQCYPDFVPTIEKYGIEWFERSIAAFYDYLTGLEGAEAEEEITPELDEEIEKIADEVFDELNPDFGKWVDGEEVETGFGDGWIDEEKELIEDIISTVSEEGYWYTCIEEEKAIVDKYIDINDDLGCFEFYEKDGYYHLFDVHNIEEYIVNAIVAEAGKNCVADVSGAWDEYTDYDEYLDWDYISQCVADEFNNAELKDDYLFNYWECADAIYKAIDRHGDEIKHGRLKLNWDIFEEDFADYMVADDEFADEVMSTLEDWMDIEEWLTYDDGLYLRLPDDEEEVAPVQSVEDYIMDISSRPSYVKKENITIEYGDKELVVGLFGSYFVKLYNDDVHAAAYCSEGLAWGKEDLMFAYDIMDYKSHIWAIVNEAKKVAA